MKVWIDKHGGMHYHKAGCKAIQPSENPPHFKYEEIEHQVRHTGSGFPFDPERVVPQAPNFSYGDKELALYRKGLYNIKCGKGVSFKQ